MSNLPWIARQVFRSENVDLAEIAEKLKKAVEHYSSSQSVETVVQSSDIGPGIYRMHFTCNPSIFLSSQCSSLHF